MCYFEFHDQCNEQCVRIVTGMLTCDKEIRLRSETLHFDEITAEAIAHVHSVIVGDRVEIVEAGNKRLLHCGQLMWLVAGQYPVGKNDGTTDCVKYFECPASH